MSPMDGTKLRNIPESEGGSDTKVFRQRTQPPSLAPQAPCTNPAAILLMDRKTQVRSEGTRDFSERKAEPRALLMPSASAQSPT
jgi:hypothetical protein